MATDDDRARLHGWVLQKSGFNAEPSSGPSARKPENACSSDGGRGGQDSCGPGRIRGRGPATAGVQTMNSDRRAYMRTLRNLVESLALGRVPVPDIVETDQALYISPGTIQCPPLPANLCDDINNHSIEAHRIAKVWYCKCVAEAYTGLALNMVGAINL